jgi:hypothetical protein
MWDDMNAHWNGKSVLNILGHPIPIVYWPDVYKWWRQDNWDTIKSNYVDWKVSESLFFLLFSALTHFFQAVVKCFCQGTPDEFWQQFKDDKGRYLSFTAIAAHLTAECAKENQILAEQARQSMVPISSLTSHTAKGLFI